MRADRKQSRRTLWVGGVLIVLLSLIIFGQQANHEFTNWDDNWLITENRWIRSFSGESMAAVLNPWVDTRIREELGNEYLPVRDLSSMVNYALHGYDAKWWHLTDLLLHALVSALVMLLSWRLTRNAWAAALAGALFAVMPIHVEVVSWASCRKDLLSAVFGLLSVHMYLKWRGLDKSPDSAKPSIAWLGGGLVCFLLALFSKVPVITLPGVVILCEAMLAPRLLSASRTKVIGAIAGYFAIAVFVFAAIAYPIASNGLVREPFGGDRLTSTFTALASFVGYLSALVTGMPIGPAIDAPLRTGLDGVVILSGVLCAVAIAFVGFGLLGTWRGGKLADEKGQGHRVSAKSLLVLGIGWLLIMLFPVSNVVIVTGTAYADRYAYLPSIGVCVAVAALLAACLGMANARLPRLKPVALTVTLALCGWQGYLAFQEVPVWRSSMTLWNDVLARDPDNHNALFNRALVRQRNAATESVALAQQALLELAEKDLRAAYERPARTFRYDQARVIAAVANIRLELAALAKTVADEAAEQAVKHRTAADRRLVGTGSTSSRAERDRLISDAEEERADADAAEARRLAALKVAEGHLTEVLTLANDARQYLDAPWRIKRDRDYLEAQIANSEGLALDRLGRTAEAEAKFRAAAILTNRNPAAYLNLAAMLARRGSEIAARRGYDEAAAREFREAVEHIDAYDAARGYIDRQSLSYRGQVLSKHAEAIEGLTSKVQPEEARDLYSKAAKLFESAAAMAREVGSHFDMREWKNFKALQTEMLGRIPGQEEAALRVAKEAASAGGVNVQAELRQAQLLLQTGKSEEALRLLSDLIQRFPSDGAVRRELAAIHASIAQGRHKALMQQWESEYRALVPTDTSAKIDHYLIMAKFLDAPRFKDELDKVSTAFERSLSYSEPDSETAKMGAAYLTSFGHALVQLGRLAEAEALLRKSYAQNPDLQLTAELLAVVYFAFLEGLMTRVGDAEAAGQAADAERFRAEMWDLITNLIVVSPRASELLAAQLVRRANEYRIAIDDKYVKSDVGQGHDLETGKAKVKEWIPSDLLSAYVKEMAPAISLYELARTLDPNQRNALTQLNDYYSKTGQYEETLKSYAALEKTFLDRPQHALELRKSAASLLTNWALDLQTQYRLAIREERDEDARKLREQALDKLIRADVAWQRAIELAPARPDRSLLSSAGAVLQQLAVLDLRGALEYLARATRVYTIASDLFLHELTAVTRKRALLTRNQAEKLQLLREAIEYAKTIPDAYAEIGLDIATIESGETLLEARRMLDAGESSKALEMVTKTGLQTREARLIMGLALDALGRKGEAANLLFSVTNDAKAQRRAAEVFLESDAPRQWGDAGTALTQALVLLTEEEISLAIQEADLADVRSRIAAVEELREKVRSRSVQLVEQARTTRSFLRKAALLRDATLVAPSNFEAHAFLGRELREWGRVLVQEAEEKIKSGDRVGEAEALQAARDAFEEAAVCWLNAIRLDPPFIVQFRGEYLDLLLNDSVNVQQGQYRESMLVEAQRQLTSFEYAVTDRANRFPDDPALTRHRAALASLKARYAKLTSGD